MFISEIKWVSIVFVLQNVIDTSTTTRTKPNILFIIIDDLRHLSDQMVNLPNINKIIFKGGNFENAFAQQALCAPSRNSLLTGRRPDSLRLYDFNSYWRDTIGNFTTIPQYFKKNNYETYSVGKVFHPGKSSNFTDDYPYSWSEYPYHPSTDIYKEAAVCNDSITQKLQRNLICPVDVSAQPEHTLPDLQTLDYATNIISNRRDDSKPFFLAVGFHKPHIPLKFPMDFLSRIPISKVKPPIQAYKPELMPLVAWHPWTDVRSRDDIQRLNISFPLGIMPKKWTLKIRQSYYAAAIYVDYLIGILMSYVDLRKTIVVLTSDHGWSLGENGLWAKYSNYDAALRVPLIFLAPGLPSKKITGPVELIDIFPTLVHLAGLPSNILQCKNITDKRRLCFDGKSLVPFLNGEKTSDLFAISQYPRPSVEPQQNSDKPRLKHIKIMGYSIRTKRYRYAEWISFNSTTFTLNWNLNYGIELYDHINDPYESNNLYLVSKYDNIKHYLSTLLKSQISPNYT